MQFLKTLSRLHENTIRNKQRDAATLYDHRQALNAAIERLRNELSAEKNAFDDAVFFQPIYIRYIDKTNKTINSLLTSLKKVEENIQIIEDEIHESFGEKKKADLLWDQFSTQQREKIERQINQQLDEVALQQHVKKSNNHD